MIATGAEPRLSRFQLASAVSPLLLPGAAMMATSCLPSGLMLTDWIDGILAKSSTGRGAVEAWGMCRPTSSAMAVPKRAGVKRDSMVSGSLWQGTSI
ncbi:hypothetical protein D3C81_2153070 [compost metagenome]